MWSGVWTRDGAGGELRSTQGGDGVIQDNHDHVVHPVIVRRGGVGGVLLVKSGL